MACTFMITFLLFVGTSLSDVVRGTCWEDIVPIQINATTNGFLTWQYTLNGIEIHYSRLYFKNDIVAAYGSRSQELVKERYKRGYDQMYVTANETELRLKNITEDDEGVYELRMVLQTGAIYCKWWNLTVANPPGIPASSNSLRTTTNRQPSSPGGNILTSRQHPATTLSERNIPGQDSTKSKCLSTAQIAFITFVAIGTCLSLCLCIVCYIRKRHGVDKGSTARKGNTNTSADMNESGSPLVSFKHASANRDSPDPSVEIAQEESSLRPAINQMQFDAEERTTALLAYSGVSSEL